MISIKQGDRKPDLEATLRDGLGNAIDLTGTTVTFAMQALDGRVVIADASVTIVDAPGGKVRYSWAAADTAVAGRYQAEFHVTFGGGTRVSVPSEGYLDVVVEDRLG
jgi:hypothetical protein